ncbi:MAG: UDP-N-acetylglucosamine 2-epimerase (non-hydrolyzing) [Clostridia bacterium]|nr:UDP-N-acetylglucosamine 2-epimerase (non-hydrolyzing) [Clostridia bacterium]
MKKKKILLCLGTRPDAIKMCPLYLRLRENPNLETYILSSGQHREMTDEVLDFFSVRADFDLEIMKKGQSPSYVVSKILEKAPPLLDRVSPDLVLVHGDTATALGCALAAHENKIPVGHVEAGLRSGDITSPFPEEGYRKRITELSAVHFAPSESARNNLLAEGVSANNIYVTGNTVIDAMLYARENSNKICADVKNIDYEKPLVLLTCHRRENLGDGAAQLFSAVKRLLCDFDSLSVLFPMHKNEQIRAAYANAKITNTRMLVCEPLDYASFLYAMQRCRFIISDSGGVAEEAAYLGKPTVIARDKTERTEAISEGPALLCGTDTRKIYETGAVLLTDTDFYRSVAMRRYEYGDGYACKRIESAVADHFKKRADREKDK